MKFESDLFDVCYCHLSSSIKYPTVLVVTQRYVCFLPLNLMICFSKANAV